MTLYVESRMARLRLECDQCGAVMEVLAAEGMTRRLGEAHEKLGCKGDVK